MVKSDLDLEAVAMTGTIREPDYGGRLVLGPSRIGVRMSAFAG